VREQNLCYYNLLGRMISDLSYTKLYLYTSHHMTRRKGVGASFYSGRLPQPERNVMLTPPPPRKPRTFTIAWVFLLTIHGFLHAQTASEIDLLLANKEIAFAHACRFTLAAAAKTGAEIADDQAAFTRAHENGWLPKQADADNPIRMGELSFLIMRAFNMKGSFLYALFPNPRYAFRELDHLKLLPGRRSPMSQVSGEELLWILGMVLSYLEERMASTAKAGASTSDASTEPSPDMPNAPPPVVKADPKWWLAPDTPDTRSEPPSGDAQSQWWVAPFPAPDAQSEPPPGGDEWWVAPRSAPPDAVPAGESQNPVAASSADFGILISVEPSYDKDGKGFQIVGGVTPWISAALGKKMDVSVSAKLSFVYGERGRSESPPFIAELERAEATFRPVQMLQLTVGRQRFKDNAQMIASGFFDGFFATAGLGWARLSVGAFYTGLQYKKSAEILMTTHDQIKHTAPVDYGDPDSYFASRRIFVPVAIEFPDLTPRTSLSLMAIGQFDVNAAAYAAAQPLHTQYMEARYGVEAADTLRFTVAGIGFLAESAETAGATALWGGAAAALDADWITPGRTPDMLSFKARWGSGVASGDFRAFLPISGLAQGLVFTPALSGLLTIRLSYAARLLRTFSLAAEGVLFWRTDRETVKDAELDGASKDPFLGGELAASCIWSPQSAIIATAGGGVFLPGRAFVHGSPVRWKIHAGVTVSL
jgi:hypothetical protein